MPVEPVKLRRLYQEVADQLSKVIATGEFKPGQRLPSERDLAASLQVSRPTIREAMIALELAGAIEIRTGSGIFVVDNEKGGLDDDAGPGPFELIEARVAIEGEAAAMAAERMTKVELAAIERAHEQMEEQLAGGLSAEDNDRQFHRLIARASQNSAMVAAVDQLWDFRARLPMWRKLHDLIRMHEEVPDWTDDNRAILDHRDIVAALQSRNPAMARSAMQSHLKRVRDVLMKASELDVLSLPPSSRGERR